ncbi:hypothetical protein 000TH008_177 [Bacillus phage 000TH008]|nr:hypothetical protein 000TH008_177 [Bacillus phage 000TH008]QQO40871.1 hypothetical protein 000TH009_177 [Bacillus phage 000TH009]
MQKVYDERAALEEHAKYIREERTRLLDEYNMIINRLRELDDRDYGKSLKEETKRSKKEIAMMSLQEAIDRHNNNVSQMKAERPKSVAVVDMTDSPKRSSQRDVKQVTRQVANILKEAGMPVKMKDIMKSLEAKGVPTNSPYALMSQVTQYDDNIRRVTHGYYQYKR